MRRQLLRRRGRDRIRLLHPPFRSNRGRARSILMRVLCRRRNRLGDWSRLPLLSRARVLQSQRSRQRRLARRNSRKLPMLRRRRFASFLNCDPLLYRMLICRRAMSRVRRGMQASNHLFKNLSLPQSRRRENAHLHNRRSKLRPALVEFQGRPEVERMRVGRVRRRHPALRLTLRGSLEMGRWSVATAAGREARRSP